MSLQQHYDRTRQSLGVPPCRTPRSHSLTDADRRSQLWCHTWKFVVKNLMENLMDQQESVPACGNGSTLFERQHFAPAIHKAVLLLKQFDHICLWSLPPVTPYLKYCVQHKTYESENPTHYNALLLQCYIPWQSFPIALSCSLLS